MSNSSIFGYFPSILFLFHLPYQENCQNWQHWKGWIHFCDKFNNKLRLIFTSSCITFYLFHKMNPNTFVQIPQYFLLSRNWWSPRWCGCWLIDELLATVSCPKFGSDAGDACWLPACTQTKLSSFLLAWLLSESLLSRTFASLRKHIDCRDYQLFSTFKVFVYICRWKSCQHLVHNETQIFKFKIMAIVWK